ncbi:non-canonical purine NTP pyrophosphatase [Enterovibrio norvegicus FF-162]|uniref:non-canonical purine NTP pyrophosphatase n=1 Tax=Enterovibrio norvegicus TaxID=188144 RepID=UPI0003785FFD|nr:non-canonical purine NTP pyrophosphatase [Enterovibrio norvegicus]OEE81927.1 non-canonical purine NTP pyrophosphatase [Enterovibrio norvegicus FF-162]
MQIRFVSKNDFKVAEVQKILEGAGVEIIAAKHSINEIQTENVDELVKDKLLKAFKKVGRPVFIEHTGLYIDSLNGFPGGLTQIFWDKLEADKFSTLLGKGDNLGLVARTIIGYCDAKKMHFFKGEIRGVISPEPKGDRSFQWDCIFIPEGETETFAEMGEKKNEISMRKIAFDKFKAFLERNKL